MSKSITGSEEEEELPKNIRKTQHKKNLVRKRFCRLRKLIFFEDCPALQNVNLEILKIEIKMLLLLLFIVSLAN